MLKKNDFHLSLCHTSYSRSPLPLQFSVAPLDWNVYFRFSNCTWKSQFTSTSQPNIDFQHFSWQVLKQPQLNLHVYALWFKDELKNVLIFFVFVVIWFACNWFTRGINWHIFIYELTVRSFVLKKILCSNDWNNLLPKEYWHVLSNQNDRFKIITKLIPSHQI